MISNERSWPSHQKAYSKPYSSSPRPQPHPASREDLIKSSELQIERKAFLLMLKQNPRGRFLRIAEEVGGRNNSIIVPDSGFAEFLRVLGEMVKAADELPSPKPPVNPPKPDEGPQAGS